MRKFNTFFSVIKPHVVYYLSEGLILHLICCCSCQFNIKSDNNSVIFLHILPYLTLFIEDLNETAGHQKLLLLPIVIVDNPTLRTAHAPLAPIEI